MGACGELKRGGQIVPRARRGVFLRHGLWQAQAKLEAIHVYIQKPTPWLKVCRDKSVTKTRLPAVSLNRVRKAALVPPVSPRYTPNLLPSHTATFEGFCKNSENSENCQKTQLDFCFSFAFGLLLVCFWFAFADGKANAVCFQN